MGDVLSTVKVNMVAKPEVLISWVIDISVQYLLFGPPCVCNLSRMLSVRCTCLGQSFKSAAKIPFWSTKLSDVFVSQAAAWTTNECCRLLNCMLHVYVCASSPSTVHG